MEILALVWVVLLALFAWRLATGRKEKETLDHGRELLMSGMAEKALPIFERLSLRERNAPGRERALYWLGRTREELGDTTRARRTYKQYLDEYVHTAHGQGADPEIRQLVLHRLKRIGHEERVNVTAEETSEWARYKAERDALLVKVREKHDAPHVVVEPHVTARLITPPEAEPVSPEKIAKDLHAIAAGRRLGEYVLAEKLGEGGFGEVYRALRPVAIKLARDPSVVEHLRRFGTIQSQIKSDRVVKPLEINLQADPPYVVMELVDGCTLRDLLETKEVKDREALTILREVALGLKDAHEAGILHLDLKPENVLVDESGKVKLTDFELGKMNEESAQARLSRSLGTQETDAKLAGTIAYMSPEQRDGKVPDARSDIYTYGILLFEALTGEHPQPGDKISDFRKDLAHVAELDRIFERCFTRHERRYASTAELAKDVQWLTQQFPHADMAGLMKAAPRARARVAQRSVGVAVEKPVLSAVEGPPGEKAPVEKAHVEKAHVEKAPDRPQVHAVAKEPKEAAPTPEERAAADALIAARAAAARAAEALRPPITIPPITIPSAQEPAPVRPPIPIESPTEPAPRIEKPQLEAG